MTREDIECIIKWFSHIEQLATDGKTANGVQMPPDEILATIKVVAKDSREYVEKFFNESIPNDLEEAAKEYAPPFITTRENQYKFNESNHSQREKRKAFIAGAEWQKEQSLLESHKAWMDHKSSMIKQIEKAKWQGYDKGLADGTVLGKEQMLNEAMEARVHLEPGANPIVTIGVGRFGLKARDKVRVIVLPKEDI